MIITTATILRLSTAGGLDIGTLAVEEVAGDRVAGTFTAGSDYPAVAEHFRYFEELADGQVLSLIDQAADAIERLGILADPAGEPSAVPVSDVQIYSDGGASLRLPAPLNGRRG